MSTAQSRHAIILSSERAPCAAIAEAAHATAGPRRRRPPASRRSRLAHAAVILCSKEQVAGVGILAGSNEMKSSRLRAAVLGAAFAVSACAGQTAKPKSAITELPAVPDPPFA